MKIGLIGLPHSGKTTIFNALTRSKAETSAYSCSKGEPNRAVVEVMDERVSRLAELYKPKRITYATVEFMDFAGLSEGVGKGEVFSGTAMAMIKQVDALALVISNFQDGLRQGGGPLKDLEKVELELVLSDMMVVEKRLERIAWSFQRGQKNDALKAEEKVMQKISDHLNGNQPVRTLSLGTEETWAVRGFQFLSGMPLMVILNSDEKNFGHNADLLHQIGNGRMVIEFAGQFEMELSRLEDKDEARLFMEDMGIMESARDRLTQFAYSLLGYISFFTVGQDEVRAWTIHRGDTAVKAAGVIHSDLSRGFIRAECFSYSDLMEYGSEKAVREKGRFRLEGKDYVVQDRDILSIRSGI